MGDDLVPLPTDAETAEVFRGLAAFVYATNSAMVFTGSDGETVISQDVVLTLATGANSLNGS